MLYKYILDDSIKNPTPILTADHLTWPKKGLPFPSVGESLHDHGLIFAWPPPSFNGPFFVTPLFSESQKVVTLPLFPPPLPLLISDKSLIMFFFIASEWTVEWLGCVVLL